MSVYQHLVVLVCAVAIATSSHLHAAEPIRSPQEWIQYFSENWSEARWEQGNDRQPGYMRSQDDSGWKSRMLAMQGCVQQPEAAIPVLIETLQNGTVPERILAAQTIGYLGPSVPVDKLASVFQQDMDAAVRLYLVDSIGMLGKGSAVDWDDFSKRETNRDVQLHVRYLRERGDSLLDTNAVQELQNWNPERIDSARVAEMAPEFSLQSAQGQTVRLSDYRGKKAIVLFFIYGDT